MLRNLPHYQRALFLRKKKGYSYREIREEIPVSMSTLSLWLREVKLTERQQQRLRQKQVDNWLASGLGEWNRKKRQQEIALIRVRAKQEIGSLTDRELLISGIMLYWAEGNKVGKMLGITNADPSFMLFMLYWFRRCLNITEDRFSASIHYHQGQDFRKIEHFWSEVTGIPLEQFRKPFCKPPGTGHRKHYLQWGVIRVYVRRSADMLHEVMAWKDGLIGDVISGKSRVRP